MSEFIPLIARFVDRFQSGLSTSRHHFGRIITAVCAPIQYLFRRLALATASNVNTRFDRHTGLLNLPAFMGLFESCLQRSRRQHRECGVLVFELSNYRDLFRKHGKTTADVALVMAAHYLTRIANQGDITARVGEDRFALVTEGLVNKEQMQNMGVVLVAKTYRANDMLPPGVKLQFKVVVCLVDGRNVTAQHAFDRLVAQVQTVADGRNRPVQMIDL